MSGIYLPARNSYYEHPGEDSCHTDCVPLDQELSRYAEKEFPDLLEKENSIVYSVPRHPIQRSQERASLAEEIVFYCLKELNIPGLWAVFFQGRSYGGKSFRNDHSGRLMIREHDYVMFTSYKGTKQVTLIEVKSTSDSASDSKAVKNSKRSAQHQLRDHIEMLNTGEKSGQLSASHLNCFIFWPFLSGMTVDPSNKPIVRWKDEDIHVFKETFQSQNNFTMWFKENILTKGKQISENIFDSLFKRFIILSCGVFVDEIHEGMLALLSQEQLDLLNRRPLKQGHPLIIHGAAGTGKTLLVIKKLQKLYEEGQLHKNARALYICYWPGIRYDVEKKLETLGILEYVDTTRFFISIDSFMKENKKGYKHIFMDESEAICLSFEENIINRTFQEIFQHYQLGNSDPTCNEPGTMWFLVDINQASLFLPKHSPNILKSPDIVLTKVIRSTCNIYKMFRQFYQDPIPRLPAGIKAKAYLSLHSISAGHEIAGPPIYWVNSYKYSQCLDALVAVIIDLCSTKGIKPNDICVLPFFVNDNFLAGSINQNIETHFVEHGFMPQGMGNVESFLMTGKANNFLIPWILRVKGLEFKVVVMVIEEEDMDFEDAEDRRKVYIMASRCTCLLIMVSPPVVKEKIDSMNLMKEYPFVHSLE